jgi:hypothetical protein
MWDLTIFSERKGVGFAPTESLSAKLTRSRVVPVSTTQQSKESAYSRLQLLLSERSLVLPDHPQLLAQLKGIVAKPTPLGGLRIEARTESLHDDLADALAFAVAGLPEPSRLASPPEHEWPGSTQWAQTPSRIRVPLPVGLVRADESYATLYGGYVTCAKCGLPYPTRLERCNSPGCGEPSPQRKLPQKQPAAAATEAAAVGGPRSEPVASNGWASAYLPRDARRCLAAGHVYPGIHGDNCPQCHAGSMGFLRGARPSGAGFGGRGGFGGRVR